jgi:hypothetical protein
MVKYTRDILAHDFDLSTNTAKKLKTKTKPVMTITSQKIG